MYILVSIVVYRSLFAILQSSLSASCNNGLLSLFINDLGSLSGSDVVGKERAGSLSPPYMLFGDIP